MKTIFSSAFEVIHVFAQQEQTHGRSSNVFFYNEKIYSYGYHYLLGEFINKEAILINDRGYSNTTNKHISILKGATSHLKRFYTTETDGDYLRRKINDIAANLIRAKKPEKYLSEAKYLYSKYCEYCDYAGKQKNAYLVHAFGDVLRFVDAYELSEYQKREKEAIKAKEQQQAKELSELLARWKNHEINEIWGNFSDSYLRINRDENEVQTTKGVKIPIPECKVLFNLIKSGKDVSGLKIGYYTIKSCDKRHLVVGCHNIPISEVFEVGNQL